MTQLYVISQIDLDKFGCPYCGGMSGGEFLSFGTCSLWGCECCGLDTAIVKTSVIEVFQIRLRHTNVHDLVGKHPHMFRELNDRMVENLPWFGRRFNAPERRA